MTSSRVFQLLLLCLVTFSLLAQKKGTQGNPHLLNPSSKTVQWGHYWSETPAVLHIQSGDFVRVHTLLVGSPDGLEKDGLAPELVEKELRAVQVIQERGPGPEADEQMGRGRDEVGAVEDDVRGLAAEFLRDFHRLFYLAGGVGKDSRGGIGARSSQETAMREGIGCAPGDDQCAFFERCFYFRKNSHRLSDKSFGL